MQFQALPWATLGGEMEEDLAPNCFRNWDSNPCDSKRHTHHEVTEQLNPRCILRLKIGLV
jgi:hypothetical protein